MGHTAEGSWALLDLLAILVLGSGVYLWLTKWHVPVEVRIAPLQAQGGVTI